MMLGKEKVRSTETLRVGDWIILEQNNFFYKGYIIQVLGQMTIRMFCIGYYDNKGNYITENKEYNRISTNTSSYTIYKEDTITFKDIEDKTHILDITIDTQDKDWFSELAN